MKRALILCLFLAISSNVGRCANTYFPPLLPLNGATNIAKATPELNRGGSGVTSLADPFAMKTPLADATVNYPKIDKIEHSLYGRAYRNQDISARLSRIESSIFSTTYPNSTLSQRVDNIVGTFNQINDYKNISKNVLSGMESKILHQDFPQNDTQSRIERLEQEVFGAVQSGDITKRYDTLRTAVKRTNNQTAQNSYQDPLDPFSTGSMNRGGVRGLLGSLGGMMTGGGGVMTGFTPSIDPFYDGYNGGTSNFNSYGGYNNNNRNTNSRYNGYNNGYNSGYNSGYNNNNLRNNSNRYNSFAGLSSPSGYGQYQGYRSNHGYADSFSSYGAGTGVTILD